MLEHIHAKGTPEFAQAKQYRTVGKFCNLSYSYRVGAKKATSQARAKHGMDVDEGYIAGTQRVYKASYPGVKRYWQRQINVCRQQGYAETLAGRRVQLRGNWQGPQAWSLESTAINFPIQGTGADQKYLALKCLHPVTMKYGAHFYYELHDGLFFIIPKEHTAQALPEMRQVLDNLPYTHAWGYTPRIPLPWDCKVGDSWGSMKEVAP
jgi:DNA polymerase I-like protein with 3'-5' exonuclease and polymerase domains